MRRMLDRTRRFARHARKAVRGLVRNARGMTVLEVSVSMALMLVVSLIMYEVYIGSMRAGQFLESHGDLAQYGQKAVNQLKTDILSGRFLFQNDTLGQGYLTALTIPAAYPVQADSRLPTVDTNGVIAADTTGQTRVGNALMIARQLPALTVSVSGSPMLADRYQFSYVYLSRNSGRKFAPATYYVDLVQGLSPVYADYYQLTSLTGATATAVATALYNAGVTVAWNPGQPVGSAFYNINSSGSLSGPIANPRIAMTVKSLVPQMRGGRISGAMAYSVGMITTPAINSADPIYIFGQPNGNFPGGFEVLCVGPAGARKVVMRLVMLATYSGKVNSQVNFVTSTAVQM